jgi:hypothetical protein
MEKAEEEEEKYDMYRSHYIPLSELYSCKA